MNLDQLLRDSAPDRTEMRHQAQRLRPVVLDRFHVAPPRRRSTRSLAAVGVAAAAATAYVVVSPGGPAAVSSAYAVEREADGDVVVTIHRLEDADGLEAALRKHGIDAAVSFEEWPAGITHEFSEGDHSFKGSGRAERPGPGLEQGLPHCGFEDGHPATITDEGDDWVLLIPADSPLQHQEVSITTGAGGALGITYADEDTGITCNIVSAAD